jgi:HK97 family phage portal protein
MGLLATRMADEVRGASNWLNDDDDDGPVSPSGVRVTRSTALSLTTIFRCWDLLSSAVSMAPVDLTVKTGGKSFPEYAKPRWLSTPNPADPNYDGADYFGQVALSTLSDGNYFSAVFPYVLDPEVVILLDPSRVEVKPGPLYDVKDANGKLLMTLDPMQMLHGWWIRPPGELRGVSPLEALRRGIGSAVAAEEHAARFFGQGAALSFGVEVPYAMDPTKQETLRSSLKARYLGRRNSHAIGVLTDGAKFVSGLAPSPEQAQMLETRKFSVEDLCRPYGVPPSMAGSQEPGAASYASAAVWDMQFKQRAVQPLATRIERRHDRLLMAPLSINDPNATMQLRFNLDAIARADLLTRYQAHEIAIRSGFATPDEERALEDKAPMAGGDQLYMQSQMVPIGMLGQPPEPPPVRSVAEQPVIHVTLPEITPPSVTISENAIRLVQHVPMRQVLDRDPVTGKPIGSHEEPI